MEKELIDLINSKCPCNQGIFTEPYGIPYFVKEPVIYCRYKIGGVSGGSCWDSSNPRPYSSDVPEDRLKVVEITLEEIKPNITFLQYNKISEMIKSNEETEWEYYGNNTEWKIEYILLSEFEDYVNSL